MGSLLLRLASALPPLAAVIAAVGIVLLDKGDARALWVSISVGVVGVFLIAWLVGWLAFKNHPRTARYAVECGAVVSWAVGVLFGAVVIFITQELLPNLLKGKENEDNVDLIATAFTVYVTTVFLDHVTIWNPVKTAMSARFKKTWHEVPAADPNAEVKKQANDAVNRDKLSGDVGWNSWSDRTKRVRFVQDAVDLP